MYSLYHKSQISNLKSGHAFCVVELESSGEYLLVIFQMTFASDHPIKSSGLHDIFLLLSATLRDNFIHKALVFVIPKYGLLDNEHIIADTRVSDEEAARDFKQYVYRHEI